MAVSVKEPKRLEYNATMVHREDLSDKLTIFRVQPDPREGQVENERVPEFIAGQYAVLGANNESHPEKGPVRRPYSVASPPEERRWLEFYIRLTEKPESENPLTPLLWRMKRGDRLWLGPKITGRFTLLHTIGEDDPRLKVFVAAGTGLAPFVSILKDCLCKGEDSELLLSRFLILHGASHPHELGYKEDLELALRHVKQRYFPTVSQAHLYPGWKGYTGRVETFFDEERLETLEERIGVEAGYISPARCVVYVCGLHGTISETMFRLLRRGFVPNHKRIRAALRLPESLPPSLFFEQYDTAPIIDLRDEEFLEKLRAIFPQGLKVPR